MEEAQVLNKIKELEATRRRTVEELRLLIQQLKIRKQLCNFQPTTSLFIEIEGLDGKSFELSTYHLLAQFLTKYGIACGNEPDQILIGNFPIPLDVSELSSEQEQLVLKRLEEKIKAETGITLYRIYWENFESGVDADPKTYKALYERFQFLDLLGLREKISYEII